MKALLALMLIVGCSKTPPAQQDPDKVFWTWFSANAAALSKAEGLEIIQRVQPELAKVNRDIKAELGQDGDRKLLVITADGIRKDFPIVKRVVAAAPEVPGWKIVAFRQRSPEMRVIEMNGHKLDADTMKFLSSPNGEKLNIDLFIPGYDANNGDSPLAQLAYLALDHSLGEYDVETRLAGIDMHALDTAPANARPFPELVGAVDKLKR